ncbi:MAG: 5'-nucleotidase C-terminal domain-containing protein [Acholeplasmataceae bacterium]
MTIKRIFIGIILTTLTIILSACEKTVLEVPDAPTNLMLENSMIKWDKSESASTYQVFLDSGTYEVVNNEYDLSTHINLFTNHIVEVYVKAENSAGVSGKSNVLRVTYQDGLILEENIEPVILQLETPTNLTLTKDILIWSKVSNATNYSISIGETSVEVVLPTTNLYDFEDLITTDTEVRVVATAENYLDSLEATILVSKGYDGRIYPSGKTPIQPDKLDYIDFYYINDLHGAIEPSDGELGMAYIANYLNQRRLENPSLFLLAGGDMLQGSALSNYYQGLSTIYLMNLMGFDAMSLGNHEFDWGLETVTQYFDGNQSNGEAAFPLLAINAFKKGTKDLPEHILPYTVIERGGYKVGIIGSIGSKLESSIAYSRVEAYEFNDPFSDIKDTTRYLREHDKVDVVVVMAHDFDESLNYNLANLTGLESVDVVFTAHTHQYKLDSINNTIIIQSGANGQYLGHVRLDMKNRNNSIYENLYYHEDFNTPDLIIQNQIDMYKLETDDYFNTTIIQNGSSIDKYTLTYWLADLMKIKTNADIALHNFGGTREGLSSNEAITLGRLYDIFPFDNIIKTVYLSGSEITRYIKNNSDYNAYSTDITDFESNKLYKVATNDYVFDYPLNPFTSGTNQENTGILLRDMVQSELELQAIIYSKFSINNPIQTLFVPEVFYFNKFEFIN